MAYRHTHTEAHTYIRRHTFTRTNTYPTHTYLTHRCTQKGNRVKHTHLKKTHSHRYAHTFTDTRTQE